MSAAGYEIAERGVGQCPGVAAEQVVIDTEQELLAHASKHFGIDFTCQRADLERRAIELFSSNIRD